MDQGPNTLLTAALIFAASIWLLWSIGIALRGRRCRKLNKMLQGGYQRQWQIQRDKDSKNWELSKAIMSLEIEKRNAELALEMEQRNQRVMEEHLCFYIETCADLERLLNLKDEEISKLEQELDLSREFDALRADAGKEDAAC